MISRAQEEFDYKDPAEALQGLRDDTDHLIESIIDMRDFMRAKARYDAWSEDKRPVSEKGELPDECEIVDEIVFEIAEADIAAQAANGSDDDSDDEEE